MGCDIHTHAERKVGDRYEKIEGLEPFDWRAYGMYGFLAGVRNYSDVTPIAPPRGIPADASAPVQSNYTSWGVDAHSASWLDVRELADFDYEQPMEDRRYTGMDPRGFMNGAVLYWHTFQGSVTRGRVVRPRANQRTEPKLHSRL